MLQDPRGYTLVISAAEFIANIEHFELTFKRNMQKKMKVNLCLITSKRIFIQQKDTELTFSYANIVYIYEHVFIIYIYI